MPVQILPIDIPLYNHQRPDAIILSGDMFIQACKDISSTWSKQLQTIYWDATTTLPEEVILNIRQIQESSDDDDTSSFPGLLHLCIDYIEQTSEEKEYNLLNNFHDTPTFEHARRMTFFSE